MCNIRISMYEARRAWRLETSGEEQQLMTDGSKMMTEKGPEVDVMLAGDRDSKKQRRS